jgi:hypothetical protein
MKRLDRHTPQEVLERAVGMQRLSRPDAGADALGGCAQRGVDRAHAVKRHREVLLWTRNILEWVGSEGCKSEYGRAKAWRECACACEHRRYSATSAPLNIKSRLVLSVELQIAQPVEC